MSSLLTVSARVRTGIPICFSDLGEHFTLLSFVFSREYQFRLICTFEIVLSNFDFFCSNLFFYLIDKVLGVFLTIFSLKELKKSLKMMLWPCRSQSDRSWRAWLVWKVISRPSKPQLCFSFFLHLRCRRSSLNPRRHGICIGVCIGVLVGDLAAVVVEPQEVSRQ